MHVVRQHLLSALGGAALLGFVLLASGVAQSDGTVSVILKRPVQVIGQPAARDMVRIVEGSPFTVPTGRLYVVTGIGNMGGNSTDNVVLFDGVAVLGVAVQQQQPSQVPPGLVAGPGMVVSVTHNTGSDPVVLGYLEDE